MADVLLAAMPFGPLFAPSLGLSLLKAGLARAGVAARARYFTLDFAERIGEPLYSRVADGGKLPVTALAGEWIFSAGLAPGDALGGNFMSAPPESAELAFRTSAYSFKALAEALVPLMDDGGSLVGMDFDATVAWPIYDWMGVAKAALESVSRYLARDLGERNVRVNLISAGPVETPAAQGIPGFEMLAGLWKKQAPLGWNTSDPAPVADAVLFLLSDLARAITGEILHVDGGFHAMGAPLRP